MKVNILGQQNSVFSDFIAEIRDVKIQGDSMRFRRNLERIGEVFAYEISKELGFRTHDIETPLGISKDQKIEQLPVLATILRAGLPMHNGLLNYFDRSPNAFVSAYRRDLPAGGFDVKVEYLAAPSLEGCTLILSDPMLATGQSMLLSYEALLQRGTPSLAHIVAAIASEQAMGYLKENLPSNTTLWVGAVDKELNDKAYIIPGLGDAGDLAFGNKL
jgi:uracil phosphoribosyltransferase